MSIILSLSPPFSLFLPLFFRLIPWSTEALCIRFPAWTSKTQWRRRSVSSFQLEGALHLHSGERVPAASVNRASPLSGTLLAFCVNQGISASILSSLIHSFIHLPTPFLLRVPLDPAGAGPRHKRQVRWSGIPISFRIFQFIVIHTVKIFGIVMENYYTTSEFYLMGLSNTQTSSFLCHVLPHYVLNHFSCV